MSAVTRVGAVLAWLGAKAGIELLRVPCEEWVALGKALPGAPRTFGDLFE